MKAKELIEILQKNPELDLGIVTISMYLGGKPETERREIMLDFVHTFGKMDKKLNGNEIYLSHIEGELTIYLWDYSVCKIVGHIVKKRMVQKPAVPVDMVMVEEDYTIPVSDCQIENGEVKTEDVKFIDVVAG